MYFNERNENTNIDGQFKKQKKVSFDTMKKYIIIGGIILALFVIALIIILLVANRTKYSITLNGSSEITIYQGTTYNEPGYDAYDNKNNHLNEEVKVMSNLDRNTLGTYTITYTIHNVSVSRKINVVERPNIITVIHIKGDKTMYLSVGQTFIDPGCESAIDAIDGDITYKIVRTGNVDTSRKGTYRIVYSVINSSNVTTSEVRTVIVE